MRLLSNRCSAFRVSSNSEGACPEENRPVTEPISAPNTPLPLPLNSGSSIRCRSRITERLMFSDFRISTWVSMVAESTAMSPSTDCCWNSCTLRVSITIAAVEVNSGAAVKR
ncbi:hypothetical protein ACVWZZ_006305 [Bradyrhizobium sp. LM6.10]